MTNQKNLIISIRHGDSKHPILLSVISFFHLINEENEIETGGSLLWGNFLKFVSHSSSFSRRSELSSSLVLCKKHFFSGLARDRFFKCLKQAERRAFFDSIFSVIRRAVDHQLLQHLSINRIWLRTAMLARRITARGERKFR